MNDESREQRQEQREQRQEAREQRYSGLPHECFRLLLLLGLLALSGILGLFIMEATDREPSKSLLTVVTLVVGGFVGAFHTHRSH